MSPSASRLGRRVLLIAAAVALPGGLLIPVYYFIRRIRNGRTSRPQN